MLKKIFSIFAGLALLGFTQTAYAVTPTVSIRLEQPKSPTGINDFPINFVALTTNGSAVTVRCYKKSPTDGDFSQFGSDIVLSAGGNTDNCSVNSSVLNQNGTFQFYATATDSVNSVSSTTVTVDYNTSGPGTPSNYSKDHPSSCQYIIKFRTANDSGKTVKVELYRSDNTTFTVGAGSRVGSQSIGSDTNGQFENSVPDCSKTYYYVIRAFDSAGNGSGLVGDSNLTTTVTGSAASTTSQQAAVGGAIAVGGNQTGVAGENAAANNEKQDVLGKSTKSNQKEVKGAQDQDNKGLISGVLGNKNVLIALGAFIIAVILYLLYRRQNAK